MTDDVIQRESNEPPAKKKGGITGKGFIKGDPRINRLGRPRSFDALRELGQQIAHEAAKDKAGEPIVFSGKVATIAEMILRSWAQSTSPQLQRAFIEVAFGKVPDDIRITLDRMSDDDLAKAIEPYLARFGIGIEPPDAERVEVAPDLPDGDNGAA